ncbi:hypothetical protein ACJX0J_016901, partial [Zea mays]
FFNPVETTSENYANYNYLNSTIPPHIKTFFGQDNQTGIVKYLCHFPFFSFYFPSSFSLSIHIACGNGLGPFKSDLFCHFRSTWIGYSERIIFCFKKHSTLDNVHHLVDHTIVIPLAVTNLLHGRIQKQEDNVKENETHYFITHQ